MDRMRKDAGAKYASHLQEADAAKLGGDVNAQRAEDIVAKPGKAAKGAAEKVVKGVLDTADASVRVADAAGRFGKKVQQRVTALNNRMEGLPDNLVNQVQNSLNDASQKGKKAFNQAVGRAQDILGSVKSGRLTVDDAVNAAQNLAAKATKKLSASDAGRQWTKIAKNYKGYGLKKRIASVKALTAGMPEEMAADIHNKLLAATKEGQAAFDNALKAAKDVGRTFSKDGARAAWDKYATSMGDAPNATGSDVGVARSQTPDGKGGFWREQLRRTGRADPPSRTGRAAGAVTRGAGRQAWRAAKTAGRLSKGLGPLMVGPAADQAAKDMARAEMLRREGRGTANPYLVFAGSYLNQLMFGTPGVKWGDENWQNAAALAKGLRDNTGETAAQIAKGIYDTAKDTVTLAGGAAGGDIGAAQDYIKAQGRGSVDVGEAPGLRQPTPEQSPGRPAFTRAPAPPVTTPYDGLGAPPPGQAAPPPGQAAPPPGLAAPPPGLAAPPPAQLPPPGPTVSFDGRTTSLRDAGGTAEIATDDRRWPQTESYLRGGVEPGTTRINDGLTIAERIQRSIDAGAYRPTTPARIAEANRGNDAVAAGYRGLRDLGAARRGVPEQYLDAVRAGNVTAEQANLAGYGTDVARGLGGGLGIKDALNINKANRADAKAGSTNIESALNRNYSPDSARWRNAARFIPSFLGDSAGSASPADVQRAVTEFETRDKVAQKANPWLSYFFGDDFDVYSLAPPGTSIFDNAMGTDANSPLFWERDNQRFRIRDKDGQYHYIGIDPQDMPPAGLAATQQSLAQPGLR
jgi:hypothetical protein